MTAFPNLPPLNFSSQRATQLLENPKAQDLQKTAKKLALHYRPEKSFQITYNGNEWGNMERLWFECLSFFIERKKGDWSVLFQLGIRDIENFLRDRNTEAVFDVSDLYQSFETRLQEFFAAELAFECLSRLETQSYSGLSYPQKVAFWTKAVDEANRLLEPHLSLELISLELGKVLSLEDEKASTDRVVVDLVWRPTTLTWTQSAKDNWTKGFFKGLTDQCKHRGMGELKWVAEGGQFP